jgi:hypothetical protein
VFGHISRYAYTHAHTVDQHILAVIVFLFSCFCNEYSNLFYTVLLLVKYYLAKTVFHLLSNVHCDLISPFSFTMFIFLFFFFFTSSYLLHCDISGSHAANMKMAVFCVVTPCSLVEVYRRFRGASCLHHQMDASPTFESSVNFYQTTRRNSTEDSHLDSYYDTYLLSFLYYFVTLS